MTEGLAPVTKPRGVLSARRIVLLATTVASLGAAAVVVSPAFDAKTGFSTPALAQNLSQQAQTVAGPVGFADIVEKVKPAVVSVRVKKNGVGPQASAEDLPFPPGSPFERFFRRFGAPDGGANPANPREGANPRDGGGQRGGVTPRGPGGRSFTTGQGSGFFISADGFAVTNNHVVENADTVEVTTDDGKSHTAKVIGTDTRTDLALIKVDGGSFPYVHLGEKTPRVGDWVLAVGNPFGLGGTVTAGIVSARGRDIGAGPYDDFIQIDAPVNRGNSGGPTFDTSGTVIGVNTAIFSPSGGNVGIAFAIPAETVRTVVAQLKDKGTVSRGWIGVQIQPVTPEIAENLGLKNAEGALVAEPQANSPAVKAGIEAGDVITTVDGQPLRNARELARRIGGMAPGATVKLGVVSKGKEKTVSLTLGELPAQREARAATGEESEQRGSDEPRLGLTLAPAGGAAGGTAGQGVVVTAVDPDGVAAAHGLRTGDVILEVSGRAVTNPNDIRKSLADARTEGKRTVLMRVKTGEATKFVAVPLARG
jgi:serine protease Do